MGCLLPHELSNMDSEFDFDFKQKHLVSAFREELRASQHLTARDTAAEDAAIQAQRRRIEEREDADRAAVTEARRQLERDVRASQQAFMQHHAQQRYVWLELRRIAELMEQCLKAAAWGCPVGNDAGMALLGWGVSLPDCVALAHSAWTGHVLCRAWIFLVSQLTEQRQLCVTGRLNSIRRTH